MFMSMLQVAVGLIWLESCNCCSDGLIDAEAHLIPMIGGVNINQHCIGKEGRIGLYHWAAQIWDAIHSGI